MSINIMDKEYKITFTIEENPEQLAMCKKWKGKTVKLSELPAFIEEVGEVVLFEDEVEIYNGYRE